VITDVLGYAGGLAGALVDRLAGASLALVAVALALHIAKLACRARAWQNIVASAYPEAALGYRHSLGAYLCGVGLNSVAPARPGEILKLALVRRKAPETRYEGLASTLVTESAFDILTAVVAVGMALTLGWTSLGGSLTSRLGPVTAHPWLVVIAATAIAAVLLVAWRWIAPRTREAARGLAAFGHPRLYLRSVVSWQAAALALRLGSLACWLAAFDLPTTVKTALVILAVQYAASLLPLTPNGAGTQQALLAVALGSSFAAPQVIGFSAGAQLATTVVDVALGGVALLLLTGSLRWRRILAPAAAPA
jgi:hypothetical protein